MGRLDTNQDQSSDQIQFQPSQQDYTNYHDEPPPLSQDDYIANNVDEQINYQQPPQPTPNSYPSQPAQQPPPETYPPQNQTTYPPQQPPPETYPPQKPTAYPPQQAQQHPNAYPPQRQPVAFPPPSPQMGVYPSQQGAPQSYPAQNYNYTQQQVYQQQQPVSYEGQVGYQIPVKTATQEGIPIGSQYLAPTQGWSSDLFACMDDPENAIITACFPCVTFGQIAEIVDNGQTSCTTSGVIYGVIAALIGVPCLISCSYRTKIRSRYGLMETPAPDWVTHCFCEWCALCQEYRQLKAQGIDPAIGWQGNMEKNQAMQYNPAMAPPSNQTMMG